MQAPYLGKNSPASRGRGPGTRPHWVIRFMRAWIYSFRVVPIFGRSWHLRTFMGLVSLAAITIVLLITLMMAVVLVAHGA